MKTLGEADPARIKIIQVLIAILLMVDLQNRPAIDSLQMFLKEKLQTKKIRAKQNSDSPYKAGININHEKFGPGVILDTQGAGDDMVLIVKFKTGGIKNLLARIAGKKITIL